MSMFCRERRRGVVQDPEGARDPERAARGPHAVAGEGRRGRLRRRPHLPRLALRVQPELAGEYVIVTHK